MNKLFVYLFLFIIIILSNAGDVFAAENLAGSSGTLIKPTNQKVSDSRAKILKEYLEKYNSPLASLANTFIETADKYNLDWKLVIAISGVESTFGKQIPGNSYNAWGWGIFGNNIIRFSSWKEGVETISEGLRTNFIDKWGAKDVYEIGKLYAASPTWAQRVTYFMNTIEEFKNQKLAKNLSISL